MSLIYACVANRDVILAEFSTRTGNFAQVVKRILEQVPSQNGKMSYVFEKHYFHYEVSDGLTFLCMADESFGRRIPFAFLDDIKNRFKSSYGTRGLQSIAYAMQADFSRVLERQMAYYSSSENADRITAVRAGLDEVKGIMINNIDKVLERGEHIELLVDKTENLSQSSIAFKKKSTELKHAMWWKNVKLYLLIALGAVIVAYVIATIICGFPVFQSCWSKKAPTPITPHGPKPTPTPVTPHAPTSLTPHSPVPPPLTPHTP